MSWDLYMLEDICDVINGGSWSQVKYISEGVKVIKVSNLVNDGIDESNMSFLPLESLSVYEKNILKSYDLVVTTVGSHPQLKASAAGRGFIISPAYEGSLLNQNCVCIRTKNDKILFNRYLGYIGRSDDFRHYIQQTGRGAANQMRIPISNIKSYELSLPPLPTQKRISSILSAYDDLIENNLKRIKLLEETAQNIYKEWFVNFRFPNYENTSINQETGLPEGWEKVNLYDFAEVKMGFPFKADDFNEANIGKPAIRIRDIPNNWTKTYTTQEVSEVYTVEQGDILIGMDGFFYLDIWGGQKGYLVQRVCRLRSFQKELQGFLIEALREPIKYYEKTISGATVAHLGAKHLKEIFITVPKGVLIIEQLGVFNKIANQKITLLNQNQNLKEARDILLPRLMNRTIEV